MRRDRLDPILLVYHSSSLGRCKVNVHPCYHALIIAYYDLYISIALKCWHNRASYLVLLVTSVIAEHTHANWFRVEHRSRAPKGSAGVEQLHSASHSNRSISYMVVTIGQISLCSARMTCWYLVNVTADSWQIVECLYQTNAQSGCWRTEW